MLDSYFGQIEKAINGTLEKCVDIVRDFQDGKLPARDVVIHNYAVLDFLEEAGLIYSDLYDLISGDLDIVLASYPSPDAAHIALIKKS